jgi:ATP-dependent DNA ligase
LESIFIYALDLIELDGDDLRRDPLAVRKATLASVVAEASPGIRFNERIEGFRKISGTGQKLCSNLKAGSQLIS